MFNLFLFSLLFSNFCFCTLIQTRDELVNEFLPNNNELRLCNPAPFGDGDPMLCEHMELLDNGRGKVNVTFESVNVNQDCPGNQKDFPYQIKVSDYHLIAFNASNCSYSGKFDLEMNNPLDSRVPIVLDLSGDNTFSEIHVYGNHVGIKECLIAGQQGVTKFCCGKTAQEAQMNCTTEATSLCGFDCIMTNVVSTPNPTSDDLCGVMSDDGQIEMKCCSHDAFDADVKTFEDTTCCKTCFGEGETCVRCPTQFYSTETTSNDDAEQTKTDTTTPQTTTTTSLNEDQTSQPQDVNANEPIDNSAVIPIVIGTAAFVMLIAIILVVVSICYVRIQMKELRYRTDSFASSQSRSSEASSNSQSHLISNRKSHYGRAPVLSEDSQEISSEPSQYGKAPAMREEPSDQYAAASSELAV